MKTRVGLEGFQAIEEIETRFLRKNDNHNKNIQ
jgi:hypothetical protein